MTEAQFAAVTEDLRPASGRNWSRRCVTAVDEMIDQHEVERRRPGTPWPRPSRPPTLFELLFVIGSYLSLAGVLNSLGLRGDPPVVP